MASAEFLGLVNAHEMSGSRSPLAFHRYQKLNS